MWLPNAGPLPPMTDFAYRSAQHFLKTGPARNGQPFALAGVAWDGSVTNRPGARFGPDAIRRSSQMLCDGIHPHFDVSPLGPCGLPEKPGLPWLGDLGDLPLPNTSLASMRSVLEAQAASLLGRHHMVWLGGDHSITLSLLRAYRAWLGQPLAVLHFDAHCDTWADHFGEPSGHGTWVREAFEEGLAATLADGVANAFETIASGAARQKLEQFSAFAGHFK